MFSLRLKIESFYIQMLFLNASVEMTNWVEHKLWFIFDDPKCVTNLEK